MSKKYFTLDEANAMVPQLLEWIPRLQELHSILNTRFPDVQKARSKAEYGGGSPYGTEYLGIALEANHITRELESKGCELKGVEMGLVDFPAIRDGKEVYLCWKVPEKEIRYWHDLYTGYAGRKPI